MEITRRQLMLGSAALGAVALGSLSTGRAEYAGPIRRAPELIGRRSDWLNTDGKALQLYGPDGLLKTAKAVMVDFWEYTCINCIRTMPYLREWDRRYRDKGLVILGIHTPEFAFARMRENVADAAERFKLTYPLLLDSEYSNWLAYGNNYWPRKYLIDPTGRIVYDHIGEGGYGETETEIQRLLLAADPSLSLPKPMEPLRGADKPGAVCYPQTPELYAGYERGFQQFGSPGGMKRSTESDYADATGEREHGKFYARGRWKSLPESIRHARTTTDPFEDYIALRYMALEANAVLRPEGGKPFDLYLKQDGKPIPKADKGADVRYKTDGNSYVRVDEPRMYQLVNNRKWGKHDLMIGSPSPDLGLYAFTFSSCEVGGTS